MVGDNSPGETILEDLPIESVVDLCATTARALFIKLVPKTCLKIRSSWSQWLTVTRTVITVVRRGGVNSRS